MARNPSNDSGNARLTAARQSPNLPHSAQPTSQPSPQPSPLWLNGLRSGWWLVVVLWWLSMKAYTSRWVYLLNYGAMASVSPALEMVAPTPWPIHLAVLMMAAVWLVAGEMLLARHPRSMPWALAAMGAGVAPWLFDLAMHWSLSVALIQADGIWGPSIWQPLWLAGFTGLAARWLSQGLLTLPGTTGTEVGGSSPPLQLVKRFIRRFVVAVAAAHVWIVWSTSVLCGLWWYWQSRSAYDDLLLGFNDCGHFAQRIATTAAGRGMLLESPVLPAFWDHFNPGLLLLVPLWWLWPGMHLIFAIQAFCLAGTGPLVAALTRRLGYSSGQSILWVCAWLMQPVLGQMNLAYGYGWHPISLALPLLLASLIAVLCQRWGWAVAWSVLACAMEEGCLVVVATTAATLAGAVWIARLSAGRGQSVHRLAIQPVAELLPGRVWIAIAAVATVVFVIVYRTSGLAPFQTGRFITLGDTPWEIIASPVTRPEAFWGQLLRSRNFIFIAGLLLPCGLWNVVRGWPWLLAIALPLGVLMVWNHLPAQSLAFHYATTLLPLVWMATWMGARAASVERANAGTWASLAAAAVAGVLFGQLPWSMDTLSDMRARTYSDVSLRRAGSDANVFIRQQLEPLREQGIAILATGRLATHLVGALELETVGQFPGRRGALSSLTPGVDPLLRYSAIVLDRLEGMQQTPAETAAIEQAARELGFQVEFDRHDLILLRRPESPAPASE